MKEENSGARRQTGTADDSLTAATAEERAPAARAPWTFVRDPAMSTVNLTRKILDADGNVLMADPAYYPWCPDNDADWYLMTAAPELLDALINLTASIYLAIADPEHNRALRQQRIIEAQDVIAKATGR